VSRKFPAVRGHFEPGTETPDPLSLAAPTVSGRRGGFKAWSARQAGDRRGTFLRRNGAECAEPDSTILPARSASRNSKTLVSAVQECRV